MNAVTMTLLFATVGFMAVLYAILRGLFGVGSDAAPRRKSHDAGYSHSTSSSGDYAAGYHSRHDSDNNNNINNGFHSQHDQHSSHSTTQPSDHSGYDAGSSGDSGGGDSGGGGDGGGGGGGD